MWKKDTTRCLDVARFLNSSFEVKNDLTNLVFRAKLREFQAYRLEALLAALLHPSVPPTTGRNLATSRHLVVSFFHII
jgi:hypothetical protein